MKPGRNSVPFPSSKEDSGIEMRAERWTGRKPHAGKHLEAVTMVKRLRRANPVTRRRKIADELTAAGAATRECEPRWLIPTWTAFPTLQRPCSTARALTCGGSF